MDGAKQQSLLLIAFLFEIFIRLSEGWVEGWRNIGKKIQIYVRKVNRVRLRERKHKNEKRT